MFIDGSFLGPTLWEAGIGVSLFSKRINLQCSYSYAQPEDTMGNMQSFFGNVLTIKLRVNIFDFTFGSLFGPSFDFLGCSLSTGMNLIHFSESLSGRGLYISAISTQLEFPKIHFQKRNILKLISVYSDLQNIILSSVVDSLVIMKMSFGTRIEVL